MKGRWSPSPISGELDVKTLSPCTEEDRSSIPSFEASLGAASQAWHFYVEPCCHLGVSMACALSYAADTVTR